MDYETLLIKVKQAKGITGNYQDDTLKVYIDDAISYMEDAGVPQERIYSSKAIGTIARGVTDLWTNESGAAELSPYFKERVIQLRIKEDK